MFGSSTYVLDPPQSTRSLGEDGSDTDMYSPGFPTATGDLVCQSMPIAHVASMAKKSVCKSGGNQSGNICVLTEERESLQVTEFPNSTIRASEYVKYSVGLKTADSLMGLL